MLVEVEGGRLELSWREAAALLTMRFIEWGALTLSDLELVAGSHAHATLLASRLRELGLVREYSTHSFKLYELTEEGARAADAIRRMAEELELWGPLAKALGEA